jgi:hypothetical protein
MIKSINGCWCDSEHKSLYPILKKWLNINSLFAERENGHGPWGDTERSSVGILAAAVWKSNNYCFEEYHFEKRNVNVKGKIEKGKYKGRIDIWFSAAKSEYVGEAKRCYPKASLRNSIKINLEINKTINNAMSQVRQIRAIRTKKIAIVFVNPRFNNGESNYTVQEFVNKITTEIECNAMAWVFPKISRNNNVYDNAKFPGTILIIKAN